jgi:pentatricopeptide repeat protein
MSSFIDIHSFITYINAIFQNKIYANGLLLVVFIVSYYTIKCIIAKNTIYQKPKINNLSKFVNLPEHEKPSKTEKVDKPFYKSAPMPMKLESILDYEVRIKYWADKLNEEKCIELFDKLIMTYTPTFEIYYSLLTLFLKNKKINQALGMYNDMKVNNYSINEDTYYSVIKGCLDCDNILQASEILLESFKSNILVNREIYNQAAIKLVSANIRFSEKYFYINEMLNEFKRYEIKINNTTFFNMLKFIKKIK